MKRVVVLLGFSLCVSCHHGHEGHEHGQEHAPDHGHDDHHEEKEVEPIAITRWADGYELFVEFPPPEPDQELSFHAHLTQLDDFSAVRDGRLSVRFERNGVAVAQAQIDNVARPGIFTPKLRTPLEKGSYELVMSYEKAGKKALFRCGAIALPSDSPKDEAAPGEIVFLKEAQWKIEFGTDVAQTRPLARELELPVMVEPAGSERLSIGAPTSGRFFHEEKIALAEGQEIKKGALLGSIAPNVEGDDLSRLELAVDQARIGKQRVERELARVKPLVEQGLLPDKRLAELESERAEHDAELSSARRRLGRVLRPGGKGGVSIRSTLDGVISQVLVPNGEPVDAGATLLRLRGSRELWLRARFVARPEGELEGAVPAAIRGPDGKRRALGTQARFVSREPTIDPETRVATWIARADADGELSVGQSAVLVVRVGEPKRAVAVPYEAVVEIDTRTYVFVQKAGESFEKRRVELGRRDGGFVEIVSGIERGQRVVMRGGFDLHLASLSGAVESHRH